MGGVDIADQLIGYYLSNHRTRKYFWRRVLEHKLMQACANAWVLFKRWLNDTREMVEAGIASLEKDPLAQDPNTAEARLLAALQQELKDLKALHDQSRAEWQRALSRHLMSQSSHGNAARGGKRARKSFIEKFKKTAERRSLLKVNATRRYCRSDTDKCKGSSNVSDKAPKRKRSARTSNVCFCDSCSLVDGVVICEACHADDELHEAAYNKTAKSEQAGTAQKPLRLRGRST